MSGHRIGQDILTGLSGGYFSIADPGTGNTLDFQDSHGICQVVTAAAAETRSLPDPDGYPVGTEVTIIHKTDGGDFVLTEAGSSALSPHPVSNTSLTFYDDGDLARFIVVDRAGTKYWHVLTNRIVGQGLVETVTAANVITATENGKTFFLNNTTGFASTLPAAVAGLKYRFVIMTALTTGNHTVVVPDSAEFYGHGHGADVNNASDYDISTSGDNIFTFVGTADAIGDWAEFTCDGTNWHVIAGSSAQAAQTFTQ